MPLIDLPLQQLKVYKPPLTRRKDFNQFWTENIKISREQPLNSRAFKVDYPVTKLEAYSLSFDGFLDKTPISAWLLKPNFGETFPALLFFHGYGGNKGTISDYLGWVLQGYVVMAVDIRGQSGESPDYARYPSGSVMGNMTKGILDRSRYYYRHVYMDCFRALEILLDRDDVKKDKVGITGISQGGGIALVVSALDKRVALSLPEVPYLCHFERAIEIATQGPYLEILDFMKLHREDVDKIKENLSYFDAMNFAPEIKCPTLISVGLIDTICPASTIFAVFNYMNSERRELSIYPGMGHESLNVHQEKKIRWATEQLLK